MRSLTDVETTILLGIGHKDYKLKPLLIDLYNTGRPESEHLKPVQGRYLPGRGTETLLYRETLPDGAQEALDRFEGKLKAPFVGGGFTFRQT